MSFSFSVYFSHVASIKRKNNNMKDYTDKIEKYLRGQMSHEEEMDFKNRVKSNALMRLQTYLITMIIGGINK